MKNDINKTLKRIDNDLKDNEVPLPKAAPTLPSPDAPRPREREMYVSCHIHPYQTLNIPVEFVDRVCFGAECQDCDWQLPSEPAILEDPDQLYQACVHAHENAHNVTCIYSMEDTSLYSFEIPCQPLEWWEKLLYRWHRHSPKFTRIVSCIGGVYVGWYLYSLFLLKADGWEFWLNCVGLGFWGFYFGRELWDRYPQYRERLKQWAIGGK